MNQWKFFSRAVLAVLVAVALNACGFHLRGNIPLSDSIKNMAVLAAKGEFRDALEDILTNSGAEIATNEASADVILNITNAKVSRTVGTLDERGKANSYNFVFKVSYELEDPNGKQIRQASLVETRRYNFDPDLVLESESEEEDLLEDMHEAISLRIVRQLSSIVDYKPDNEGQNRLDQEAPEQETPDQKAQN